MPLPSGLASDLRERRQKAFSIPVTNLYHQPVRIEGEQAKGLLLLRLLDGRRNRFVLSQDLAVGITNIQRFPPKARGSLLNSSTINLRN